MRVFTGHAQGEDHQAAYSVCPVPGRSTVLSAGAQDTVLEWDPATGSLLRSLTTDHQGAPPVPADYVSLGFVTASTNELGVTPDCRYVLCSLGGQISVWDYETGEVAHILTGHTNSVTALCTTGDSRYALSASTDATVRVWDLATGRSIRTLSARAGAADSVRVSLDGVYAITQDYAARVWELATGRCVRTVSPSSSAGLTADDLRVLTIAGSGEVSGTHWRGGVPGAFQVSRPRNPVDLVEADQRVSGLVERALDAKVAGNVHRALDLLQEARRQPGYERASQLTGAWRQLYDSCVHVDLRTGHQEAVFAGFRQAVKSVAITPDGGYAVSGSYDGNVQLWDLVNQRAVLDFGLEMSVLGPLCVTTDGTQVAAGIIRDVRVWDLATGQHRLTLQHPASVEVIAPMPDPQRLVTSDGDRNARVWNLTTGQCEYTFSLASGEADFHWTRVLCVTPDGRQAVSAHFDGTLRLWDLLTGLCARVLTGSAQHVRSGRVTGDGQRLVTTGDDGKLRVWDLLTGDCLHTLSGHTGTIYSLTLTADDRHALSAGDGGAIRVWDLAAGRCLRILTGHADTVHSVSVTPDGHRAVSGGQDGTMRVWELDWELAARNLENWKAELEPRFGTFLARCTASSGHSWTDPEFEQLWRQLTASGYGGLDRERVREELHRLLWLIQAADFRPNKPQPYQVAIITNQAKERAAAKKLAAAAEINGRALELLRRGSADIPEAYRHDLVACLHQQAYLLSKLRRLNRALEISEAAVRACRGVAAVTRAVRLSGVMYNHYCYLCQAKRRDEIAGFLRVVHREFAESVHATYLPGVKYPIDPVDRGQIQQEIVTVQELVSHYENRPADDQHRLLGLLVSLGAQTRLLEANGERSQAQNCLRTLLLAWARALRQHTADRCVSLVVGVDLLELPAALKGRIVTRVVQRGLKVPRT